MAGQEGVWVASLRRRMTTGAAGLFLASIASSDAIAQTRDAPPSFESWSGVSASENAWFAYGGLIAAPFGSVLEDGVRLRVQGGGGAYAYDGSLEVGGNAVDVRFLGRSTVTEALVGYQMKLGATITKAYAGAVYDVRVVAPLAPGKTPPEPEIGGKAVIEVWHDWSEEIWSSLDLVYETPFSAYQANARAAYRVLPVLSLGLEAGTLGNESYAALRLGLLAKWDTPYGELTVTGGLSGDEIDASAPYGSLAVLTRF